MRVLSIDGGGIRGLYTATYLDGLATQFARRNKSGELDVGKGFDLIAGTSTGGIIAAGLAAGVSLKDIAALYRRYAAAIFPQKVPSSLLGIVRQAFTRPRINASGATALQSALDGVFGSLTLGELYAERAIPLAIPAVEMNRHQPWIFKTSHLGGKRDDQFRVADICMATSAAPIYRSMASVKDQDTAHSYTFVDGGLWANSPVLVALIEALRMLNGASEPIEIFSLGTCKRPQGTALASNDLDRGLIQWKCGAEAAAVAIDAQESAFNYMAGFLSDHLSSITLVRFPHGTVPASAMEYLDLDESSNKGLEVLMKQATTDVSESLAVCDGRSREGRLLTELFSSLPLLPPRRSSHV